MTNNPLEDSFIKNEELAMKATREEEKKSINRVAFADDRIPSS